MESNLSHCLKSVIIIGGGTAGAIIAKRLADVFQVTIFEKSVHQYLPIFYRIPLMIGILLSKKNKFVFQKSIQFSKNRPIPFFESNILGGTSVINGCVHVMGSLMKWESLLSRFDLAKDEFIKSYQELYSMDKNDRKITLTKAPQKYLDGLFFKSLECQGLQRGDVEWANQPAYDSILNTFSLFLRSSVMSLFPFKRSTVRLGKEVDCLVVDDESNVIGIKVGSELYFADAVILCAGVIGTNSLLSKKVLRYTDMCYVEPPIIAGQNIKDHTNLRVNVESKIKIKSLNEIQSSFTEKFFLFFNHLFYRPTLLRGTGATSAAHLDLNGDGEVDTRIQLLNFSESGRMGSAGALFSSSNPGFSISITCINPKSTGSLMGEQVYKNLKPNYLCDKRDLEILKRALSFVIELLESEAFKDVVGSIHQIEKIKNDPEGYIYDNCYSGYHLIGGCSDLVDRNFQMKSLGRLFICDASVLKDYVSSNIHSTVVILADLFAKKFLANRFKIFAYR